MTLNKTKNSLSNEGCTLCTRVKNRSRVVIMFTPRVPSVMFFGVHIYYLAKKKNRFLVHIERKKESERDKVVKI